MYVNRKESVYDGEVRVASIVCLESILESIKNKTANSNIIKEVSNMGKVIIKNELRKMVVIDFFNLHAWNTSNIKNSIQEYIIPETGLLQEMNKKSSIEVLSELFNINMNMEEYYYLNLAQANNLNCKLINKLFIQYGSTKTGLVIELCILINNNILDKEIVNKYLKDIEKEEAIEIGKRILNAYGIKFKAEVIQININNRIALNRDKNLATPIMEGIQFLPKLKSSKNVSGLDNIFLSDIRLKYLKVIRLLSTSKSIKTTLTAYNSMIEVMTNQMEQSLSIYEQRTVKQDSYNKEYSTALKIMSLILESIFEAYLDKQEIPIELTKQVAKLRGLVG